jgi:hypothetical protein
MKKTSRSKKPAKPTPGPYRMGQESLGFRIIGKAYATIGWFPTTCEEWEHGDHLVSTEEARANAELMLEALRREWRARQGWDD